MPAKRSDRTRRTPKKDESPDPYAANADAYASFLDLLRGGHTVKHACDQAGLGRSTVYDRRGRDGDFADQWAEADEQGVEVLEQEARRRAVDGVEDFRIDRDGVEHPFRRYSDTLLIFLLKARRPDVYRDRFEHRHTGHVSLRLDRLSDKELDQLEGLVGKASE